MTLADTVAFALVAPAFALVLRACWRSRTVAPKETDRMSTHDRTPAQLDALLFGLSC
jgi:hypothetical protein